MEYASSKYSLSDAPPQKKEFLEDFRRKWIPGFDSVFSSVADVASDWYFLYTVYNFEGVNLDRFIPPLIVITLVSTVMLVLAIVTYCTKAGNKDREVCCVDAAKRVLAPKICCFCGGGADMDTRTFLNLVEDVLEDIPTIVLTAMIEIERKGVTPAGILNITTSSFNLVYNILSLLKPRNDDGRVAPEV